MHTNAIGLIVIDSVAGIYRLESDAITRADSMRKLVRKLQSLADEYECAVVCVNQVWTIASGTLCCRSIFCYFFLIRQDIKKIDNSAPLLI